MITEKVDNYWVPGIAASEARVLRMFRRIRETKEYEALNADQKRAMEEAYYYCDSIEDFERRAQRILKIKIVEAD